MTSPITSRYILCRYESTPLKTLKYPVNPQSLQPCSIYDNHMGYDSVRLLADLNGPEYGTGFVFMPEDKYFFIDIDNCITDGKWSDVSIEIMILFKDCYFEVSHSGKGLHIIGKYEGETPFHHCKNIGLKIELYTSKRFCALTLTQAQGNAETIATARLIQFINTYNLISTESEEISNLPSEWTTESCKGCEPPESDWELINLLLARKKTANESFGDKLSFKELFQANESKLAKQFPSNKPEEYCDRSSADYALAYRLIYFMGHNCERTLRIMKLSQLNREKWERNDYLIRTVLRAKGDYLSRNNREGNYFVYARHKPDNNNVTVIQGQQNLSNNPLDIKLLHTFNYPELNERGSLVLDTSNNLKFLLQKYGITVRWNKMSRIREITIDKITLNYEDKENDALRIIEDLCLINAMPIKRIDSNLITLAYKDVYHPIVEGLKNNPWDGITRLNSFIDTIKTENQKLSHKLIRLWMISAIEAAHSEKGFSASGVLVLVGKQGIGKTRWIKSLDPFNCDAVKSGALLDPTNKDCIQTLSTFWIAELGELDGTFRKSDMARIKSYITENVDKVRFSFGRKDSIIPRRTVFAASVNDPNFLVDDTGNRRWWTIPVDSIKLDHEIDMAQVWAEVYSLWASGEISYLPQNELIELSEHNKNHESIDPLFEGLNTFFDFSYGWESKNTTPMQATDVLRKMGYERPTKSEATRMGALLTKIIGKKPRKTQEGRYHNLVLKATK